MIKTPTAILLDSDCGWENLGTPKAKIFKSPSFSISSTNSSIYLKNPNSDKNYKGNPFEEINKFIEKGYTCVGYISYEYSGHTNRKFKPKRLKQGCKVPDTYFHFYEDDEIENCNIEDLNNILRLESNETGGKKLEHLSNFEKNDYLDVINKAKEYISTGDIYQVNMSQKFQADSLKNSYLTLLRFYEAQPVPFSALFQFNDNTLISGSMELFLRKTGDVVNTKPIKGTAKRSNDFETDLIIKKELAENEKERAENLMIVDLMRNDLGRICETGSVKVNKLFQINRYKTLYQMESEIEGVLRKGISLPDIISSTFPPGSVTGAPKSRALEIIDELEPHFRGPYCGAFGVFYPDGDFTLSVAIRVLLSNLNKSCYWVGGGVVWDSDPGEEYEETLLKAMAIRKALS